MIKVIYTEVRDDGPEHKGNVAYMFRNIETKELYKWSTSGNNHYGILEGKEYLIKFVEAGISNNAIRIKNVEIYEKLQDGTIMRKTNRKGTYKEWI